MRYLEREKTGEAPTMESSVEILPDCDNRRAVARKIVSLAAQWVEEFRLGDLSPRQMMTLRRA